MEIGNIIPHIEALIFASDKPLTSMEITELINNAFGFMEEKLTLEQIQTSLDGIIEKYASEFYPFEVRESGGGWQFLTKKDFHKTVAQLNGEKFLKRLSSAALETLSIVAYKQPITKGEIEAIRGVNSDYSIQKLLEKELINISGRNETMPGKPLVYSTSKTFMDYFGINSADDLPKLKEVFAETLIEPTQITHNLTHTPDETLPEEEGATEEGATPATEEGATLFVEESVLIVSEEDVLVEDATDSDETAHQEPESSDEVTEEEGSEAEASEAEEEEDPNSGMEDEQEEDNDADHPDDETDDQSSDQPDDDTAETDDQSSDHSRKS